MDDKGLPDDPHRSPFRAVHFLLPFILGTWITVGLVLWMVFAL